MSFLAQKPEGLDSQQAERRETRFSGPLPFAHGTHRFGYRLIEKPWNYWTEETGDHDQDPADYYQLAGWVALGPVKTLRAVYFNGRPRYVWLTNPKNGTKYVDHSITWVDGKHTPIRFRFYWGYDDQLVEPTLNGQTFTAGGKTFQAAPNVHPPYGGIAYCVFYALDTGFPVDPRAAGQTIQNIEFELELEAPLFAGAESDLGQNPVACVYDYLTNKMSGLALPDSLVPQTEWQDGVDRVGEFRWKELCRLSPMLSQSTIAASAISKLNAYFGGLLTQRDGQLLPDVIPALGGGSNTVWLPNHDFSDAGSGGEPFDKWTKTEANGATVNLDSSEGDHGDASLRLDLALNTSSAYIDQELKTLKVGRTYTASVRAKADVASCKFYFGNSTTASAYGNATITTAWDIYSFSFTATEQGIRLQAAGNYNPDNAQIWLDYIWIEEELTTITANDIKGELEYQPLDSEDPISEITVKYLKLSEKLESDSITERYSMTSIVRGEPKTEEVDASFARRSQTATQIAKRALQSRAGKGAIHILRSKAKNPDGTKFLAGDVFDFDYAPASLDITCRIMTIRFGKGETVRVDFEVEQSLFPEAYEPEEDTRLLPDDPAADAFVYQRAIQLPEELGGTFFPPKVAILAQRENQAIYGMDVFLSTATSGRWSGEEGFLAEVLAFAIHGTLDTTIVAGDTNISFDVDSSDYDQFIAEGFTTEEVENDQMLVLMNDEWISIGALDTQVGSVWTFDCLRGRAGSTAAGHTSGDEFFMIKKSSLVALSHENFSNSPMTTYFKIAPKILTDIGNLSSEINVTLTGVPSLASLALSVAATDYYSFKLSWTSETGDDLVEFEYYETTKGKTYAKYSTARVSEGEIIFDVNFYGGITVRARRLIKIGVNTYYSNWSTDLTDTINAHPKMSGVRVAIQLDYLVDNDANIQWDVLSLADQEETISIDVYDDTDTQLGRDTFLGSTAVNATALPELLNHYNPQDDYNIWVRRTLKNGQVSEWAIITFSTSTDNPSTQNTYYAS